ncbi:MAG: hypothetical protein EOP54_21565 [Sphingobacteriales bacterium]|nr:MAG: hypothetical protein EOP54_21565 [Sphingobacteriales bacterium]
MDLNKEKALAKLLLAVEDEHILNEVKAILTHKHIFYEDLPEHIKDGINLSLKNIEEGKTRSHEDVMKEMKNKHGF